MVEAIYKSLCLYTVTDSGWEDDRFVEPSSKHHVH